MEVSVITKFRLLFGVLCFALALYSCGAINIGDKASVSPYDFGLKEAKTGEECFDVLYRTHQMAITSSKHVDYTGIKTIYLTIPKHANSIPLTDINDFSGVTFIVMNQTKDVYLFEYITPSTKVDVNKADIDKGVFYNYKGLSKGEQLLVITDQNDWVDKRSNYNYGHVRKDIIFIKDGVGQNKVVMPYDNKDSKPSCEFYSLSKKRIIIKNLKLKRSESCTYKTFLCNIVGVNYLYLNDLSVETPESNLIGDNAIRIADCANVFFDHVIIDGTYSKRNQYGYGVALNNIWNFQVNMMVGKGDWGIFGNRNINTVNIRNSELNRFDIHCYGRDIFFENVDFNGYYNQFSSTYGTIKFEECKFTNFTPVLYEQSYNSYVPHKVVINNSVFHLGIKHNFLINAGHLGLLKNKRSELAENNWPDVFINNLKVIVDGNQDQFSVFSVTKDAQFADLIHNISQIDINGLYFECLKENTPVTFNIVNTDVSTAKPVMININRLVSKPNVRLNVHLNERTEKSKVKIRRSNIVCN